MKCKYGLKAKCNHSYDAYSLCGSPMGESVNSQSCLECRFSLIFEKLEKLEALHNSKPMEAKE